MAHLRFSSLVSLIMCSSPAELRDKAKWDGVAGGSRQNLLVEVNSGWLNSLFGCS